MQVTISCKLHRPWSPSKHTFPPNHTQQHNLIFYHSFIPEYWTVPTNSEGMAQSPYQCRILPVQIHKTMRSAFWKKYNSYQRDGVPSWEYRQFGIHLTLHCVSVVRAYYCARWRIVKGVVKECMKMRFAKNIGGWFVKIIGGGIGKFIDRILPPPHYTNVHLAEMVNRRVTHRW